MNSYQTSGVGQMGGLSAAQMVAKVAEPKIGELTMTVGNLFSAIERLRSAKARLVERLADVSREMPKEIAGTPTMPHSTKFAANLDQAVRFVHEIASEIEEQVDALEI